ncbi:LPS export ABC transporter permease LptG [Roseovarius salinarum]|uniref:LPS export ABC transporter permease LptG n=1 Tax=Roseovarius salinarum TaxID=1981892 RepID=UPI000C34A3BF|nr:LPS export ABC transporter permease LptG [Roseovarius salinarum]
MTLDLYFARKFLVSFLGVFVVFVVILTLIDLVDEVQDFPDMSFAEVLELVFLKAPEANYEIMPLVMILSTVALFVRLARSSELVVVRAAGRSALRTLAAPMIVAALVGVVGLTVFNPVVAATAKRYNELINAHLGAGRNVLAISDTGLWLRQGGARGQTVIHAERASSDLSVLYAATFIAFSPDGQPLRRIMADSAALEDGGWRLRDAKIWPLRVSGNPERAARELDEMTVPSALTRDRIVDSFGKPEFISIWALPGFIDQLEEAGFSARRYAVWLQSEISRPLFLTGLVMIAAAFAMRHARLADTGVSVLTAVLLCFVLYYIRNFAQIMGENGQVPVLLAAWAPPLATFLLAVGILLHMEDG